MSEGVAGVPAALTALEQWVCWRREVRDGKPTKVPIDASTGEFASTTEPATWTDIETALEAREQLDADGVGFVFTDDDPFVGVDLDDCRDSERGTIDEWARNVVARLDSYTEVSPSGTGVHVIVAGELPAGRRRSGDVELYARSRFFTVTGEHLDGTPRTVERRVDAIRGVHADYVQGSSADEGAEGRESAIEPTEGGINLDDEELLERARAAQNGDRFDALWRGDTGGYDSHSEADMALCLHLAFWTGGDPARMDGLFRQSGLMRGKWDAVHYADGATYGERTIERALGMVDAVYAPDGESDGDGRGPRPAGPTAQSGPREPAPQAPSSRGDESVYLAERNRLLRETVQSQAATIERQQDRLDELEEELERAREQLAIQEPVRPDAAENQNRFWGWIRNR